MHASLRLPPETRRRLAQAGATALRLAPPAGCLLVVLGAKLWLIASHGSPTPFWDQWDAEAVLIYPAWLQGRLGLAELLAPHVDHRILFTRLLAIGLLALQDRWDPILQMVAGAVLHVGTLALVLAVLLRGLGAGERLALCGFAALVFGLPFGSDNTLWGFQSQFYFLLLFSVAGLVLLVPAPAFGPRWWAGLAVACAAYLGMASGGVALLAVLTVAVLQIAAGQRRGGREWAALPVYAALFVGSWLLLPVLPGNDHLRPATVLAFVRSLLSAGAWPVVAPHVALGLLAAVALFVQAPVALVAAALWRERPGLRHHGWLLLGLWVWVALQALAIVYGRGAAFPAPRYLDIFAVGLVLNFAILLWTLSRAGAGGRRLAAAASVWVLVVAAGAGRWFNGSTLFEIGYRRDMAVIQTERVKAYLASGDIRELQDRPPLHIPYPTAERLAFALAQPGIRERLPPVLLGQDDSEERRRGGLAGFVARQKESLLKRGPLIAGLGLALLLAAATARLRGREADGAPG
ncbi:hypothetical protein PQJ75_04955 [Rhodoplanes sp. TEM]|uniref:Glycosyltransferase RgtA/B/C/D-like domain-containing protein n=1 Tax=Rhodoplanes tepidamans TaxID=200616 RepID=A0ABT5JDD0_RHOTP|nr:MULTISPECIES: hypothetical protein [Rhodoplanes]MDC7787696.1 hypothetical protein [Rhodoplanes tepidamans]MDC7983070.1 hypothetical protein [Rhodoplanes sp. TEM]MDQ0356452.1 hypothetical protein [Rhodoplanes tepidamans]